MHVVGVDVEQTAGAPRATAMQPFEEPGFVDFAVAGTSGAGEFRCADCGYGAVIRRALPSCPMCGGSIWESRGAGGSGSSD